MGGALNREVAKEVLLEIKEVLDETKTEFFLINGTLVGAIRDKNFPKSDEDIDIAAKIYEIAPKIPILIPKLKQRGFRVQAFDRPYGFRRNLKIIKRSIRTDFVCFDYNGDKIFRAGRPEKNFSKVYDRKFIDNLQEIEFLGVKFLMPNHVEEYLTIDYGPGWVKEEKRSAKFTSAKIVGYWATVLKDQGPDYGKKMEDILKHKAE